MPICYGLEMLPFLRCDYKNLGIDRIKLRMKILRGHLKFSPLEYRVDVVHSVTSDEKGKQHEVDHEYPPLFYSQFLQGKVKIKSFMMTYRCDSDLQLLGNGFRFAPVFPVVKNAGVLKTDALAVRLRSGGKGHPG